MLHFECDYACGAADVVLQALIDPNALSKSAYTDVLRNEFANKGVGLEYMTMQVGDHVLLMVDCK